MSKIASLWSPQPRRISLAARAPSQDGAAAKIVADERKIHEMLCSSDPNVRALALKHINAVGEAFKDALLSSTSHFPSQQTQGIPSAVAFGETDRLQVDVRWRMLFNVRDYSSQEHPFFKITDVYDAVTFEVYKLGERIKAASVRAEETIFEAEVIAAALQWNRLWADWQNLWNTEDGLASMQAKYGRKMAKLAYTVLTAGGLSTTSYDATGSTALEKDINTINAAAREMGNAIYQTDTGFTDSEGALIESEEDISGLGLYLLFNPATAGYTERVNRALAARYDMANDNNSIQEVNVPVMPLPTRYVPATAWYLVLPGRKLVSAIFRALELYDYMDPKVAGVADGRVGQGAYKHVRGDSRQVRQVATS